MQSGIGSNTALKREKQSRERAALHRFRSRRHSSADLRWRFHPPLHRPVQPNSTPISSPRCSCIPDTPSSFPYPSSPETGEEKRGVQVVMTERKAKDPRAPHVAGRASSPTQVGSPLLGRRDTGPFQASETSDASPAASVIPLSLDGLLFPRPCQGQDPDGKTQDQQSLSDVEGAYSRVEATEGAGGGTSRPPEKDSGLLDSVLDTLLAPSGPGQSHASPPVCEATSPWCLFSPELPQDARTAPATQGVLPPLMSRPEGKVGDSSGTAAAQKVLPRGLAPSRQLLPPTAGSHHWPGAAVKPSPQPAVVEVEEEDGSESEGSVGPPLKGKIRPAGGPAAGGGAATVAPGSAAGGVALVPKEDSRFTAPRVALAEHDAPAAPGRSPLATTVMDFIHVPILPLNSAFLAARTRQLLEGDNYDGGAAA
ncbi:Progesterone receptor, partial [Eschrichtius robustus]|nr:Progesterone receptor [Eschrichtius robustus]